MTSVPNLQQQLNGNKISIAFLVFSFLTISACSTSNEPIRRSQTRTTVVKKKKKREKTKLDTISWTEVSQERYEPIKNAEGPQVTKQASYTMGLMLPFNSSSFDENTNDRFIQFYSGMQMAIDELIDKGIDIKLKSADTEGNQGKIDALLENWSDVDLLIGPYSRENLTSAAEWASRSKKPVISPWVASNKITRNNPYYIQLRPSVRDHYNVMVEDILRKYNPENVYVLKKEEGGDEGKVRYIQEYASSVLNTEENPFNEYSVNSDSLIMSETYMNDLFLDGEEKIFISQNYLFEEDEFIYNTLRKLGAAKGESSAVVYAMPIVMDMQKVDYNLFKILNTRVIRSKYVDFYNDKVSEFRAAFLNRYSTLPTDEAFFGYDVGYYFGSAMNKFGIEFQYFLDQLDLKLLQSSFDVQKDFGDRISDDFRDVNLFANKHLDIIEFKGDRFVVRNPND